MAGGRGVHSQGDPSLARKEGSSGPSRGWVVVRTTYVQVGAARNDEVQLNKVRLRQGIFHWEG